MKRQRKGKWLAILALIWVSKQFFAINDMVKFLNDLPPDRALEAKVVVLNSQRSFMGKWSSPYVLVYREDKQH